MPASLSIGDFSRATHLSIKTLRHYHDRGLLAPSEVDPDTGYRRYTTSQIALYEFKTGTGTIAYDTSGVEPELDLNLTGNYTWDAGWGVVFAPGSKAQGTTTASAKLYNALTSTGEFSIEAWVSPANQAQTGANIVSYSGGPKVRNATLSQKTFQYQANVRSSVTDTNGAPALVTNPNNMLAQAALQPPVPTALATARSEDMFEIVSWPGACTWRSTTWAPTMPLHVSRNGVGRMIVQVTPMSWTAVCSRHGTISNS